MCATKQTCPLTSSVFDVSICPKSHRPHHLELNRLFTCKVWGLKTGEAFTGGVMRRVEEHVPPSLWWGTIWFESHTAAPCLSVLWSNMTHKVTVILVLTMFFNFLSWKEEYCLCSGCCSSSSRTCSPVWSWAFRLDNLTSIVLPRPDTRLPSTCRPPSERGEVDEENVFIGKCSENGPLGAGEGGHVGVWVGGVSLNLCSSPFWYNRKASECKNVQRSRHPQGWTLNLDFWRSHQTFELHV